jgi:hypothetical protein
LSGSGPGQRDLDQTGPQRRSDSVGEISIDLSSGPLPVRLILGRGSRRRRQGFPEKPQTLLSRSAYLRDGPIIQRQGEDSVQDGALRLTAIAPLGARSAPRGAPRSIHQGTQHFIQGHR